MSQTGMKSNWSITLMRESKLWPNDIEVMISLDEEETIYRIKKEEKKEEEEENRLSVNKMYKHAELVKLLHSSDRVQSCNEHSFSLKKYRSSYSFNDFYYLIAKSFHSVNVAIEKESEKIIDSFNKFKKKLIRILDSEKT